MSEVIRISKEYLDLIEDVAQQLEISRKAVLDGIIEWFFTMSAELPEEEEEPDTSSWEEDRYADTNGVKTDG